MLQRRADLLDFIGANPDLHLGIEPANRCLHGNAATTVRSEKWRAASDHDTSLSSSGEPQFRRSLDLTMRSSYRGGGGGCQGKSTRLDTACNSPEDRGWRKSLGNRLNSLLSKG
jgi:hypothetical protein